MDKVFTVDVMRIFRAIFKKIYFVALVAIVTGILMFVIQYDPVKKYGAETAVYSSAYGSYAQTAEGVKAVQLYSEIVNSNKIAERTASILGDNSLDATTIRGMIYTSIKEDSPVLKIGAIGTDPNKTVAVANAAAEAFIIEAQNITGGESIQILDKAIDPYTIENDVKKKCIIAVLIASVLVCAIIALAEIFSDRIYHVEDASLDGELEILGVIPVQKKN